jgi:bacteriocin-like protein
MDARVQNRYGRFAFSSGANDLIAVPARECGLTHCRRKIMPNQNKPDQPQKDNAPVKQENTADKHADELSIEELAKVSGGRAGRTTLAKKSTRFGRT